MALLILSTFVLILLGINEIITFGVLHFLAISILMFVLIQKLLVKLSPLSQVLIFAALFVATANPLFGDEQGIGFGRFILFFPQTDLFPLFALGFPSRVLSAADYFPLIPCISIFYRNSSRHLRSPGALSNGFLKISCEAASISWLILAVDLFASSTCAVFISYAD